MISAVILTKNEEKNINDCLKDLSFCDEILVIDDDSTDKTIVLAKKQGARVISHTLNGNFAESRNFAIEKARGEWIFFVDADERVSEKLQHEILRRVEDDSAVGYFIKRLDTMWGKMLKHGEQGNMQLLRLGKKGKGKWVGKVHEIWEMEGNKDILGNPLLHLPHPSLKEFLAEINFYSSIRAQELYKKGVRSNWFSIILYPKAKFMQDYIFKLGFLDGMQGFLVAIIMSFHSFLVRGKLWQLGQKS